jgi:epoxyqueuosine reductase
MRACIALTPRRMFNPSVDARSLIRDHALALGFDAIGFARPDAVTEAGQRLTEFIALGRHGEMGWLAAKADRRAHPNVLWPAARSVVMLGLNYGPTQDPMALQQQPARGIVSVYAQGRDYHDVVKGKLKQLGQWLHATFDAEIKLFVDTAPVLEKPLAEAAGLGWQGKHTNLVSRSFGSWLFLGAIYTTLDIEADAPEADHCGTCRTCLDICPTAAFPAPYQLDARRCLSYLTIEHPGPIPREFRKAMANRIYGCDDCLAVCPWNKYASVARETALQPRAELDGPPLIELATLDDAAFRKLFAGTAVKRIGRDRFVRNVAIALGNSGDPAASIPLIRLLDDASPLVRGAAVWALVQILSAQEFAALRTERSSRESDASVLAEWQA